MHNKQPAKLRAPEQFGDHSAQNSVSAKVSAA